MMKQLKKPCPGLEMKLNSSSLICVQRGVGVCKHVPAAADERALRKHGLTDGISGRCTENTRAMFRAIPSDELVGSKGRGDGSPA